VVVILGAEKFEELGEGDYSVTILVDLGEDIVELVDRV
jgi:hypothetical protein